LLLNAALNLQEHLQAAPVKDVKAETAKVVDKILKSNFTKYF
jgi:hypothetical protein